MPKERSLSAKQQRFVDQYDGNIKETAEKIGISYGWARHLMTMPIIIDAIKSRKRLPRAKRIATREDRQAFWTKILEDDGENSMARLKASELLGKSEADFTDKVLSLNSLENKPKDEIKSELVSIIGRLGLAQLPEQRKETVH